MNFMKKNKIFGFLIIIVLIYSFIQYNKPQSNPLPNNYLDDRSNFGKTTQLLNNAMDLTAPPNNSVKSFTIPKDQESLIYSKLNEGISLSKQIDDKFLDYLDPNLKSYYRFKYIKGNELFLEGIQGDTSNINSEGVKKQLEGNKLIGEWVSWWNANRDRITKKAFSE